MFTVWVLTALCIVLSAWAIKLQVANRKLLKENDELTQELNDAAKRLAELEDRQKSKLFNKTVDLLAAAGVPGLVLLGAMAASGFSGAAAITVALASLGGPAGMLGEVGVLLGLGIVIARYGITEVCAAVLKKILQRKSRTEIIREIDALPRAIPQKFRAKAKTLLAEDAR